MKLVSGLRRGSGLTSTKPEWRFRRTRFSIFLSALFFLCYAVFFVRMTRGGMESWFSQDDLLNLSYCWPRSLRELFGGILLANNYSRPVGELFYRALYSTFGFNPAPFNMARLAFCCLNLVVLYTWARRISGSREAGAIALLLGGFHPAAASLYFDTGMIFDVLAFFFYYSAFSVYLGGRRNGRFPGAVRTLCVVLLYVLALGSKEIAVTFPIALLLFELTIGSAASPAPTWSVRTWWQRFVTVAITGLITFVLVVRRTSGSEALSNNPAYHPVFSLSAYLRTYAHYLSDFGFVSPDVVVPLVPWILAGCVGVAVLARNRALLWASLFNIFAILPIAFIPPRDGFAFAVPLAGWVIYLSVLASVLIEAISLRSPLLRLPSRIAAVGAISLLILRPEAAFMRNTLLPIIHGDQDLVREAHKSLRAVLPAKLTGKRILSLHDPFRNPYGMLFILRLSYRDDSVTVDTARLPEQQDPRGAEASYDYVLDHGAAGFFLAGSKH